MVSDKKDTTKTSDVSNNNLLEQYDPTMSSE